MPRKRPSRSRCRTVQVLINGKPVKIPALKGDQERRNQGPSQCGREDRRDQDGGQRRTGDQSRKVTRRKMLIMNKEGETKSLDIDVDSDSGDGVAVGEAHVVVEGKAGSKAEAAEGTYTLTIVGDDDAKRAEGVTQDPGACLESQTGARTDRSSTSLPLRPACRCPTRSISNRHRRPRRTLTSPNDSRASKANSSRSASCSRRCRRKTLTISRQAVSGSQTRPSARLSGCQPTTTDRSRLPPC